MKVVMVMTKKTETAQAASQTALKERLLTIAERCAALPLLDRRTPDEILGYDEHGMPSA
jgi:antitoxin VapB